MLQTLPQSVINKCVVFQLDFTDFYLEESDTCLYDSLTVLGDVEGTEEIGRKDESLSVRWTSSILSFFLILFPCFTHVCISRCLLSLSLLHYFQIRKPAIRGFFCHVLCSGAVWWQYSSTRTVLPQHHGASVYVRQQHRTQGLQRYTDIHQPCRYVHGMCV